MREGICENGKTDSSGTVMISHTRFVRNDFPHVWIHAQESLIKRHSSYNLAKSGDIDAAFRLVRDSVSEGGLGQLRETFHHRNPILVCAHSVEGAGVNAIPAALTQRACRM